MQRADSRLTANLKEKPDRCVDSIVYVCNTWLPPAAVNYVHTLQMKKVYFYDGHVSTIAWEYTVCTVCQEQSKWGHLLV